MTQVVFITLVVVIIGCWFCQDADRYRRRLNRHVRVPYSSYQRHQEEA